MQGQVLEHGRVRFNKTPLVVKTNTNTSQRVQEEVVCYNRWRGSKRPWDIRNNSLVDVERNSSLGNSIVTPLSRTIYRHDFLHKLF